MNAINVGRWGRTCHPRSQRERVGTSLGPGFSTANSSGEIASGALAEAREKRAAREKEKIAGGKTKPNQSHRFSRKNLIRGAGSGMRGFSANFFLTKQSQTRPAKRTPMNHSYTFPMPADDTSSDQFDLQRFVDAQADVIDDALAEICAGMKRSHWMWFVFPQIAGLGSSSMAQRYAIAGIDEARAYLAHPVLGERLRDCAQAVLDVKGRSADDIFGHIDSMKLRSSMTLFAMVDQKGSVFEGVIEKYFGGKRDEMTVRLAGEKGG